MFSGEVDGLPTIGSLGNYLEFTRRLDDGAQTIPEEPVVVHEQDRSHLDSSSLCLAGRKIERSCDLAENTVMKLRSPRAFGCVFATPEDVSSTQSRSAAFSAAKRGGSATL